MIADAVASSHARVLVVEDEPLLRMFNADMLIDAGFEVLEAADADQALYLLETNSDIKVVFTDVEMPGTLDGFALAQCIEAKWPTIGVLVTSGRRLPNEVFAAATRCFVPKPFRAAQVVELIDAFVHPRQRI